MTAIKERPILFSAPMVRAILSGQKTVTRRPLKSPHGFWETSVTGELVPIPVNCPHGKPGDRLYVRETWSDVNLQGAPGVAYRADDDVRDLMEDETFLDEHGAFNYSDPRAKPYQFACWSEDLLSGAEGRWRPSIHMPRWACRILLEITAVRVERLQGISDAEIEREGIDLEALTDGQDRYDMCHAGSGAEGRPTLRTAWRHLWESTGGDWDANPWVWIIEFKRVQP